MKCLCNHCSIPLEFDEEALGESIDCPSCGLETVLYAKPDVKSPQEEAEEAMRRKRIEEEQRAEAIAYRNRLTEKRVCKRCEEEVDVSNLAGELGCILGIVAFLALPTLLFAYYIAIGILIIALISGLVMSTIEACPKCKSTDVVKIDTQAAARILDRETRTETKLFPPQNRQDSCKISR